MSNMVVNEPRFDSGNDSDGYLKLAANQPNPADKEEDYEQLPEERRSVRTANKAHQELEEEKTKNQKRMMYTWIATAVAGILAFIAFVLVIWTIVRVNNLQKVTDEQDSFQEDFIKEGSCACKTSDKSYQIVFHMKRGLQVGKSIEETFLTGDRTGNKCVQESLDFYIFRSDLISDWEPSTKIQNVKYTICKEGQQVAYILFDGRFSTKQNWFSPDRVYDSSWTDLNGSLPFKYFRLSGVANEDFLIQYNFTSCEEFGWTTVLNNAESCDYKDDLAAYPTILYSGEKEALSRSANDSWKEADELAIYVQLDEK